MTNPLDNRFAVLKSWQDQKAIAAAAVLKEKELRAEVVAIFSTVPEMHSGVENIDIGEGFDLKIEHKLEYKFDKENDYAKLHDVLETIEKMEGGKILADRIAKQTFEPSVSEYKKLPPEAKKLIDTVMTIKPAGSKGMEIKKRAAK